MLVSGDRAWGCCAASLDAWVCPFPQGSTGGSGTRIRSRLQSACLLTPLELAVGNKEPRSSRTCPGKTPPPFALIILFFSILRPHNNVFRPVLMDWITQRLHLRSGIQIFLEPDPASVPPSAKR